ncbi:MAG: hypothetical protein IKP05_01845 [Alphaproteobacteria bacterium]|nr:hypothetical protein [Alphaproteobacteria bacterium]
MKKFSVSAALVGVVLVAPCGAGAAYPVYSGYQNGMTNQVMVPNGNVVYRQNAVQPNGVVVPNQNQVIIANPNVAANPSRITGMLPKVGSNMTAAGRQYYQPADFDRLADSGLYVGVSAGYSASVMGSMTADYAGEDKAFFVPGAFKSADFDKDTVLPLQISVGAAINNDVRIDFSLLRYSGLAYSDMVQTSTGDGGFAEASVDGGAITANATMLNVYYNIDSYTGYIAGGSLRPYIGVGAGLSLNTIADYVVSDNHYYVEVEDIAPLPDGVLTGVSDIIAYHNGGTNEQLAFMLEGGVTSDLSGGLKVDFFVRYTNLGRVKTSGSIVMSQTEWMKDSGSASGESPAPYDSVYHYTNWYESGRLSMVDVGVRLRLQF